MSAPSVAYGRRIARKSRIQGERGGRPEKSVNVSQDALIDVKIASDELVRCIGRQLAAVRQGAFLAQGSVSDSAQAAAKIAKAVATLIQDSNARQGRTTA